MAKIIGLTGGIGSGKTTVAKMFEELGVPVYIADLEAKKITESPEVLQIIREQFGNEIFDGEILNRQRLAEIIFKNKAKLDQLNSIIHPLVRNHFEQWVNTKRNFPFVIKEAAILFESGSYKDCDKIITVTAPLEIRIKRVVYRDSVTSNLVIDRINNQWTDEMREAKSDFVIMNTDHKKTLEQVKLIYLKISSKTTN